MFYSTTFFTKLLTVHSGVPSVAVGFNDAWLRQSPNEMQQRGEWTHTTSMYAIGLGRHTPQHSKRKSCIGTQIPSTSAPGASQIHYRSVIRSTANANPASTPVHSPSSMWPEEQLQKNDARRPRLMTTLNELFSLLCTIVVLGACAKGEGGSEDWTGWIERGDGANLSGMEGTSCGSE